MEKALGDANCEAARLYLRLAVAIRDYQDAQRRGCRGVGLYVYFKRVRRYAVALIEHFPVQREAYQWAVGACGVGVN